MESNRHVRCLFCETGTETNVARVIHDSGWGDAIFAQRVRFLKKGKEWKQVNAPLLPGYVFMYTDQQDNLAIDWRRLPHLIRVLRYEDGNELLLGRDLEFADWLWCMNGQIGVVKTVQVGDHVEIVEGMFKELSGRVLHVNQRQRKVFVLLDTPSISIHTWLAFEQIDQIS